MKIVKISELIGTSREVQCPRGGFTSFRVLLEKDLMGFTVCKTVIPKGEPQHWHYRNHLEACYCIAGLGIIKNLRTGETFDIEPDTTYVLDEHDNHTFQALEDTVLISVFNPPLTGREVHDALGNYAAPVDAAAPFILPPGV